MSCPTCGHTMHSIDNGKFYCPRCGTLKGCYLDGTVIVPALIERCREFGRTLCGSCALHLYEWRQMRIEEAINPKEAT